MFSCIGGFDECIDWQSVICVDSWGFWCYLLGNIMKNKLLILLSVLLLITSFTSGCDYVTGKLPEVATTTVNQESQPIKIDDQQIPPKSEVIGLGKPLPFAIMDSLRSKIYPAENTYSKFATHVDITFRDPSDLYPLESLVNLTSLSVKVSGLNIGSYDISYLAHLKGLTSLSINSKFLDIEDWSFISSLTNLVNLELHISQRKIYVPAIDLTILIPLKHLKSLTLDAGSEIDYMPLSSLVNLTTLSITDKNFKSFQRLKQLKNLNKLTLNTKGLDGSSEIQNWNLEYLSITTEEKLKDLVLKDIVTQTNLISLKLQCKFEDISQLNKLTKLESLDLSSNQISDISSLSTLTNLLSLDLQNNKVTVISPLVSLTKLENLYLSKNKIEEISSIKAVKTLKSLWLSINQIKDISVLYLLLELKEVLLDGNPLDENSVNIVIPGLRERGVIVFYWIAEEYDYIISFILTDYFENGGYNIINPDMSFGSPFVAASTSYGGGMTYFQEKLEAEGCDSLKLIHILNERNSSPIEMSIESSPENGYIIDYEHEFESYFQEGIEAGWEKFRKDNPKAGSYITISAPVYDPKSKIIIVYYDFVDGPLSGMGYLLAFRYQNGILEGIAEDELWIS